MLINIPSRIDVYVHFDPLPQIADQLATLTALVQQVIVQETKMSAELDALTTQVTENTNVENSAVQLIQNIAAQLQAAGTDPAALQALHSQLKASADALAAAVTANTPAAA